MPQRRRPPLSPIEAALVRAQLGGGRSISRRSMLGGAGAAGLAALLAACGTSGTSTTSKTATLAPGKDVSSTDKVVNWANWPLYLDYNTKTKVYPTLEAFQKATGIKATYSEDIDDNETYYAKIQGQLKNDQDIGKDVIVLTDWMAARMVEQGYVQEFDQSAIPNAKNLLPNLKNVDYDPGRKHTITWQSGFTGLAWNKEKVPNGLKTVSDLWAPELKGHVEVLSEMRDTIGLIMLDQGVDPSKDFTADQYDNAIDVLKKQLNQGQIRQVKGNSYAQDLKNGDAWAVLAWSGDINGLADPRFKFALPEAGGMLWSDNLMIPIGSPHKANAEALINYYYDPEVAATVADYVEYVCPVQGAKQAMETIDKSAVDNPLIFPDAAYLANTHLFRSLTAAEQTSFSSKFEAALGV